jgi:hypothetical protein
MIAIAFLLIFVLCDCFKSRRRLEAKILVLRHQLNVLQQRAPRRLHLRWADRTLFIWLYSRCPRILDALGFRTIDRGPASQRRKLAGIRRSFGHDLIAIIVGERLSLSTRLGGNRSHPMTLRQARRLETDFA